MKKRSFKIINSILAVVAMVIIAALTLSVSSARYAVRYKYMLNLALAEHFTFSAGQSHTFEIPYDGYYIFRLWGGYGGDSKNVWSGGQGIYELGGMGGMVEAVAYFSKGTILVIVVGTKGEVITGGFNGGGTGGTDLVPVFNDYFGGGGGGATDVRLSSGALGDRILVAGGGGGGSYGGGAYGSGGIGGTVAENYVGTSGMGTGYGQGGGMSEGGEGYQSGNLGTGGNGNYSGGGGGGGYYGGGGSYGSGGGGGGGSSYVGNGFTTDVPEGLPNRNMYINDMQDGYAIVSYVGERA